MARHPNYELFEKLGQGENSVVYRACDLVLNRDVAIKELSSEPGSDGGQTDAERIRQFLQEASFLAQFEHENVLRIHTVDQERGWIVMELMKGSLTSQIATEPMQPDMVRSVLRQMLGALDFLHQKGKIHGAVRPSNILINEHGTVKLSDFEASGRDGELRVPKGSKKYLAPELIRSDFGQFGPAVDLYCLGFTALELLTGKKFDSLFSGTGEGAIDADVAWLRWHSSDEPMRPVKEIAANIPDDLARVIDQLLKKPVEERPQTAAAVLKLLDDAPLVPVPVPEPVVKAAKREDVGAILPSKAVKLREASAGKQTRRRPQTAPPASGRDRLNETLGKPYVLWPICLGMLAAALLIGLQLRGDRDEKPVDIVEKENPVLPVPEVQPLAVQLRVLPDASNAKLTIGGEPRDFVDLQLEPGSHEIVVEKDGFQTFSSSLDIDAEHTAFDIVLTETPMEVLIPEADRKRVEPEPIKPRFIDVRIAVSPEDAEVLIDGQTIELPEGVLRLNPEEITELELVARAEGYQPRTAQWSLAELEDANYDLKLSLDKLPTPEPEIKPTMVLPTALLPKPGTAFDELTGLPQRALVRTLQDSSPLELALVPAGSYRFGVRKGEKPRKGGNLRAWELPDRTISIEQPFYMGIAEVTRGQYQSFVNQAAMEDEETNETNQSNFPITNISVRQAAKFCDWAGGRLPTEQEWEAAVRGPQDSGYPLPWGKLVPRGNGSLDEDKCRLFRGESNEDNGPVDAEALPASANALGLLHTIGNVAEWCDNQHGSSLFIIKGCSYRIPPGDHVRVTWRNAAPWNGADDIGMRLLVPVVGEPSSGPALSFVPPSNLDSLLVSTQPGGQEKQAKEEAYTKTVQEIANQFTGPAELVIDSGGFMGEIADVSFSPDGQQIAVAGGKIVRIWDIDSGNLVKTLRGDMSRTSYGNVNAVAWSPDGQFLVVGVSDYRPHGNIRVYSTDNLDEIAEVLTGHLAPCRKLCFSRDGKLLASADADGLILVRDWASREVLQRVAARDRDQPIYDVVKFPTDEPYLLGVDFDGPQVISASSGKRLGSQDNMPSKVRGWLVDVFNNLIKLPYGDDSQPRVMDLRMEDGRWAGAGSAVADGRSRFWIRIWESRDPVSSAIPAKELAGYDKHRWNITAIALQPNGSLVASGDKFGEVHVWDSTTGERKFKFAGQGKPIYEVAFDEGSSRLAFGLRPLPPGEWNRNNYGTATRVLDLRQRTIADVASRDDLQLRNEQATRGETSVKVRREGGYYLIERFLGSQRQAQYRISSGRNPTVFTLLDEPQLAVQQPVVFGDNEGLLALWDSAGDELKRAFIGHGGLVSGISPASNGKLIATSSTDRTIRLWSLEDYVPTGIFDFKFENSAVREVVPGTSSAREGVKIGDQIVSIDGKTLTDMFESMLLGQFDYKPGQRVPVKMKRGEETYEYQMEMAAGYDFAEPILNFFMGDNGQWIIWHPQGYYDASPGADRLIGWHLNRGYDKSANFFEVQQFRKQLYRPDVIDGILETGSLERALARLPEKVRESEEVDFRKPDVIAENYPPSVKITSPTDSWQTDTPTVTVKGEANSVNGLPLTALTLLHNGSVAKVFRPTEVNQLAMTIEYEMELQPGANDLVLIAANAKSSTQGKHIVVALNRPDKPLRSDVHVLAIGVSEFDDSLAPLPSAAGDAKAFAEAMMAHENGRLYGKVNTRQLLGRVTDREILEGFQWLSDNTKVGNVAMVYIASHAIVDRRDNFYIGTSNSIESKARSTAVSWRDLLDTLQLDLPECKRVVFLDLTPTSNAIKPGLRNPLMDLAAAEMGTIFLSSNTLQQQPVPVAASDKGAFLRAVLETVGDRQFDTIPQPGDALFNPVELAAGVVNRLQDLTRDQQQPVYFIPEFAKRANVLELRN